MKRTLIVLICAFMLCIHSAAVVSAESTAVSETAESVQQTEESGSSRGVKIAGFLVIFTVAAGATAYITAAPKLKKLKKDKSEKDQMQ